MTCHVKAYTTGDSFIPGRRKKREVYLQRFRNWQSIPGVLRNMVCKLLKIQYDSAVTDDAISEQYQAWPGNLINDLK